MTILACVKVRDGLVLGSDSMTQIVNDQGIGLKAYSNARKVFQIHELPIAAMTYGAGNMGARSIEGLVSEFNASLSDVYRGSVEAVSRQLFTFFKKAYETAYGTDSNTAFGLYVAGYSANSPFPEEWEFELPYNTEPVKVRDAEVFGSSWRGVPVPFTRLYMGYDPRMRLGLREKGVAEDVIEELLSPYQTQVVYDGMPLQDAVHFARYILNTTIGAATFEIGTPSCGGPLQVAVITPQNGFKWLEEPRLT